MRRVLFYTWKDVERHLFLNRDRWDKDILDAEIYSSDIYIYVKSLDNINRVGENLADIFEYKYIHKDQKLYLELGKEAYLTVTYEIGEETEHDKQIVPLFRNVLYKKSAYYEDMIQESLPGCPVIAFHSYKGGVGRTLSLLAFVKAWSALSDVKEASRLLIVDSDIEAPGITWLTAKDGQCSFSYLDLLEITQGMDSIEEIVGLVADKVSEMTFQVETDVKVVEHFVLPTYRYIEQLLDMYASPESIVNSYNKKFILAEILSMLGKRLNVSAVLVDLRAGVSEFSAPLLFDPRVKKYLVTSTSYQSVKGTELLIQELNKGLPIKESTLIPEIFMTMIPDGLQTLDIVSGLVSLYDEVDEKEESLIDNLVTELPFASELLHLGSLRQIIKNLDGCAFYKNIYSLVKDNYVVQKEKKISTSVNRRDEVIRKINRLADTQINAEGNVEFNILMTAPINNLIKKFRINIPHTIIMGAKGSGKTFLYREMLRNKYWETFIVKMENNNEIKEPRTFFVPVLASSNASGFKDILQAAIKKYNACGANGNISNSVWLDNSNKIKTFNRNEHDSLEWLDFWKQIMLETLGGGFDSLESLENVLGECAQRVVFLFDGLEEIFIQTLSSKTEKNAILGLCQDMLNEWKVKYKNIGAIIFLRKDLARDSIEVNFEQFNTLYNSVELRWSRTEALRLVVWLVNQAVPGFYQEEVAVEVASQELIERNLTKLWGVKLGKITSNEAYSSRWILAALSDFNGQLQARDIIRFLQYATEDAGRPIYEDRYIMPAEIKKAVPNCSNKKLNEVIQEIAALKPIFTKLESLPEEKRILPFHSDTFELTATDEKLMKQEGYLKIDNDKYYLPEIIRHALKFKYERGARPKVLSLLLSK